MRLENFNEKLLFHNVMRQAIHNLPADPSMRSYTLIGMTFLEVKNLNKPCGKCAENSKKEKKR